LVTLVQFLPVPEVWNVFKMAGTGSFDFPMPMGK